MQLKTYQYRLYPSTAQATRLYAVLRTARYWYNMCVSERTVAYEIEARSVSKFDQMKLVKHYKKGLCRQQDVHSHVLQGVCADVDKAFQAFFRRKKAGEMPGYPRFKGINRFHSFGFKEYGNGIRRDGQRLKLYGIGRVAVRWHRPVEGKIKTARIVVQAGKWYVAFACELPDPVPLPKTGQSVGIDVGISALLTTSTGEKVDNPRWYRQSQAKLRIAQRSLQRKTKGSQNRKRALRRVQAIHAHVVNTRHDYLNKQIHTLVQRYDLIALEDLKITNMVRNPHLSKSILDAGWGYFKEHLSHKAVNAGRLVIFVNPAYTSKCCSRCGTQFVNFSLSTRWVECACGLSLDRDHNAAINILSRVGRDTSVNHNVGANAVRGSEAVGL